MAARRSITPRSITPRRGAEPPALAAPPLIDAPQSAEPSSTWVATIGEALTSPGKKTLKRNKKLGCLTPGGQHMSEESAVWLAHHQELSRQRLERRCARLVRLRQLPAPGKLSARGTAAPTPREQQPLERLCGGEQQTRHPPLAPHDSAPQVLVLEVALVRLEPRGARARTRTLESRVGRGFPSSS